MTAIVSDEAALFAAILDEPADDAPRLVLADWLEENGQSERGEFIRVQCELSRMESDDHIGHRGCVCVACGPLRRREDKLWAPTVREAIRSELPKGLLVHIDQDLPHLVNPSVIVRRGFVAAVHTTCAAWCGGPCGVCAGEGWLRHGPITLRRDCSACKGKRRTPGIGPAVVRAAPVETVRLTDREPAEDRGAFEVVRYGWFDRPHRWAPGANDPGPSAWDVPSSLYSLLLVGHGDSRGVRTIWYPSPDAAHAALSLAAITLARR